MPNLMYHGSTIISRILLWWGAINAGCGNTPPSIITWRKSKDFSTYSTVTMVVCWARLSFCYQTPKRCAASSRKLKSIRTLTLNFEWNRIAKILSHRWMVRLRGSIWSPQMTNIPSTRTYQWKTVRSLHPQHQTFWSYRRPMIVLKVMLWPCQLTSQTDTALLLCF